MYKLNKPILLNNTKLLFLSMMISSIIMASTTNSWMNLWMMMEINLLAFIPILSNNNMLNSESSMKYFLIQSIASMILLMSIIFMWTNNKLTIKISTPINLTLMMKLGSAPFHFWFIQMVEKMNMINLMILSTLQKIIPMTAMMYMNQTTNLYLMILLNTTIGSINGINQTSLFKIISYSSINHIGWMMAAMTINQNSWKLYFLCYLIMMSSMTSMFHTLKMNTLPQLINSKNNKMIMLLFSMNLLSMGGLPPMMGFIPKWMIILHMTMNMNFLILSIMMMTSIITLYFYIKIIYSMILMNNTKMKWTKSYKQNMLNSMNLMQIMLSVWLMITMNMMFFM
uniref:NADH-ubiquinone oxidoreductase chain 2 n=1 Tax=Pseudoneureclipsis sibuyana TaxID=2904893 RepID=A0A9E8LP88_9NEOP|nr:NADH dehydrogenase subunit 2 [Pseudoneureclipsis sibuyana]UZZ44286.1 NADH dehydrogenase subunit 2 [Pseudoneureclipsis sibuyana]